MGGEAPAEATAARLCAPRPFPPAPPPRALRQPAAAATAVPRADRPMAFPAGRRPAAETWACRGVRAERRWSATAHSSSRSSGSARRRSPRRPPVPAPVPVPAPAGAEGRRAAAGEPVGGSGAPAAPGRAAGTAAGARRAGPMAAVPASACGTGCSCGSCSTICRGPATPTGSTITRTTPATRSGARRRRGARRTIPICAAAWTISTPASARRRTGRATPATCRRTSRATSRRPRRKRRPAQRIPMGVPGAGWVPCSF